MRPRCKLMHGMRARVPARADARADRADRPFSFSFCKRFYMYMVEMDSGFRRAPGGWGTGTRYAGPYSCTAIPDHNATVNAPRALSGLNGERM